MDIRNILPDEYRRRLNTGVCVCCGQPFSSENVFTDAGRREVRISQTCEKCFDELMAELEEDEEE